MLKHSKRDEDRMKKKLVIFDMDGTILDTLDDLTDSVNYALSYCGYPKHTRDEVRSFVGNGILKLVERSLPSDAGEDDIDKVFHAFKDYYKVHCHDKTRPYPGIINVMETLKEKGFLTAVVSNKADFAVQELCLRYFLDLVDCAVGERKGTNKKPAPDSVISVMKTLNVSPQESVYIGDSDVDIETAENAGIDCIAVTWGFREYEYLKQCGAGVFAHKTDDILDMLL